VPAPLTSRSIDPYLAAMSDSDLGDLPPAEFRRSMHRVADLVADYLEHVGTYSVLPHVRPGEVRAALPAVPPRDAEPVEVILDDYRRLIEPNVTHWNHPGFMAYFGITGSGPGVLGEALAAGLNVNAMLWRTGPAATELEELVTDWLRQMLALPATYGGHINDTASVSTFLALAAARDRAPGLEIRERGMAGRSDVPALTVYASEQAHSSVDKAVIALGLGLANLRKVPVDGAFRLDPVALEAMIAEDRLHGRLPIAVVATAGTTSTTSVDPLGPVAEICRREAIWLHVDAAYAGAAAICPEFRSRFDGIERADSIVVNPHKWLFTPVDCSVLFAREPAAIRAAFSLIPDYLRTDEQGVTNLMDYGIQLGRRFRALKLWMVIRAFGVSGLRERIRRHCALAGTLAEWMRAEPAVEVVAPVPFSVVCFRVVRGATGEEQDRANAEVMARVNAAGPVFLSSTRLHGRLTLRIAIGNIRTGRRHVEQAWALIREAAAGA
jgi:aromatic-L-amino-acid decarboxylase